MFLLFIFTYISVLIFLAIVIYKFVKISKAPVHQEMVPGILPRKGNLEHNKELWQGSFLFRFAMYLFMGNFALLIIGTILEITGISPFVFHANSFWASFWSIYRTIIDVIIWVASILGILGTIMLLLTRTANKNQSLYGSPSHYFNIILIGAIYVTALWWRLVDADMARNLMGFYLGLMTFSKNIAMNLPVNIPAIGYVHINISLLFIIYIPFSQMPHFYAKYFN